MSAKLQNLTEQLLSAAKTAGAEAADTLAVDGTSLSISVREGTLEEAERAEGIDIGLRVLIGQRQACVSASDTSAHTISQMAERAVAMAREAPEDPFIGLANNDQLAKDWDVDALDLCDDRPEPEPAALEDAARRAESAAMAVAGVTKITDAGATFSRRNIHLAATNGFSGGYKDRAFACLCCNNRRRHGYGAGLLRRHACVCGGSG